MDTKGLIATLEAMADETHCLSWPAVRAAMRAAAASLKSQSDVPREPTPEMIEAGKVGDPLGCDVPEDEVATVYASIWKAMYDASPSNSSRSDK